MNASYHVIELVKRHISNQYLRASDTDAARALLLSRTAVSAYKAGRDVMSLQTLECAQTLLNLPPNELVELSLALSIEATPDAKSVWAAHKWMLDRAKRFEAFVAAKGKGTLPGILLVCLGSLYGAHSQAGQMATSGASKSRQEAPGYLMRR
jgi:hypothetical protein